MTVDYLSELPPDLRAKLLAFRAEMIAGREEQERKLRETHEHCKREIGRLKREVEVEIEVLHRLLGIFNNVQRADVDPAAR
jgi:hypothetical protein